jgi:AcrR family transcriptional regulator
MRPVPARLLRACILEAGIEIPGLTPSELEKRPRILAAARAAFATARYYDIKLPKFAQELGMSPAAFRRIFLDMESVLADILHEHLDAITAAIDAVPADAQDLFAARRAAYFATTRQRNGDFVPDHKLLQLQCQSLPPDLKDPIEALFAAIGARLSQDGSGIALAMLDQSHNTLYDAERMIAAIPPRSKTVPTPTPTIDWTKPAELHDGRTPAKPTKPTLH